MIEFRTGDILKTDAEALVNTVNCAGVMGRGIALQFKKAYPQNFKAYATACREGKVRPGVMFISEVNQPNSSRFIINFPTKRHWRERSRIEDIQSGLESLVSDIGRLGIKSIAVPPLGCGLGGLEWALVRAEIIKAFSQLPDLRVIVFEPAGAPAAAAMTVSGKAPNMTAGRAALIGLMHEYLKALMDTTVTLLEIHKLLYFLQEAGEPLKLEYGKAIYGPFASNLGHVLNHIEGHYVCGYADGGDAPNKEIKLVHGALEHATNFLKSHDDTVHRFDRVVDLVDGFETPFGMELLATVHWVVSTEGTENLQSTVDAVYAWNDRKRQFSEHQIALAYDVLSSKGWFER